MRCETTSDSAASVERWDAAVGSYIGASEDGTGNGQFLYAAVQRECRYFSGCSVTVQGEVWSSLNEQILNAFRIGQANLESGNCPLASRQLDRIETLLIIPLLQGTIRVAEILRVQSNAGNDVSRAQALAYVEAFYPVLHSCDEQDANVVQAILQLEDINDSTYQTAITILERNFECLGLREDDMVFLELSPNPDVIAIDEGREIIQRSKIPEYIVGGFLLVIGAIVLIGPFVSIDLSRCCCCFALCCCWNPCAKKDGNKKKPAATKKGRKDNKKQVNLRDGLDITEKSNNTGKSSGTSSPTSVGNGALLPSPELAADELKKIEAGLLSHRYGQTLTPIESEDFRSSGLYAHAVEQRDLINKIGNIVDDDDDDSSSEAGVATPELPSSQRSSRRHIYESVSSGATTPPRTGYNLYSSMASQASSSQSRLDTLT